MNLRTFYNKVAEVDPELASGIGSLALWEAREVLNRVTGLNLPGSYSADRGLDAYWMVIEARARRYKAKA